MSASESDLTDVEWAARLSADDCMALVHATLKEGDAEGLVAAMQLLATKDADLAAEVLATVELGLRLAAEPPTESDS